MVAYIPGLGFTFGGLLPGSVSPTAALQIATPILYTTPLVHRGDQHVLQLFLWLSQRIASPCDGHLPGGILLREDF